MGVMVAWVICGLLVCWLFVRPRLTHITVSGTVVMTYFVEPALLEQMADDLPNVDASTLIPSCQDKGFRVNIRDGSGRILAAPAGQEVQTGRIDDGPVFTLECTTTYKSFRAER